MACMRSALRRKQAIKEAQPPCETLSILPLTLDLVCFLSDSCWRFLEAAITETIKRECGRDNLQRWDVPTKYIRNLSARIEEHGRTEHLKN